MSHTIKMTEDARRYYEALREAIATHDSMIVAFSGGVDSGLLAYVAHEVLGDKMLAVIGVSASLAAREEQAAIAFLEAHGIRYEKIDTDEMGDDRYRRNNPDRCYFCRSELFSKLHDAARERGYGRLAYGANLDDQSDHRPGAIAAGERDVVAPLVDAGLTKAMVRGIAKGLALDLWDKPASPCLASRIPYFQEVTAEKLVQIERAEYILKDLGFDTCRVRHHGDLARVELPLEDHARIMADGVWERAAEGIKAAGFESVALEGEGFRSGRLNDVIKGTTDGEQ